MQVVSDVTLPIIVTKQIEDFAVTLFVRLCIMTKISLIISFFADPHPCLSTCSHLCLLKPGGYKCACPVKNPAICNESVHQTSE